MNYKGKIVLSLYVGGDSGSMGLPLYFRLHQAGVSPTIKTDNKWTRQTRGDILDKGEANQRRGTTQ